MESGQFSWRRFVVYLGIYYKFLGSWKLIVYSVSSIAASQQPLHLYLTGMNLKGLEAAKVLAENLLDTIAAECGASRYANLDYFIVLSISSFAAMSF